MSKMILLVEADAALRGAVSDAFSEQGYDTETNADGKEVLDQVRKGQPDAIVLCVELPKTSGYSICSKLKKDEQLKRIPVVLTSAEATAKTFEDHRKLKLGRAEDYLIKPYAPEDLVNRVLTLLGVTPSVPAPHDDLLGLNDLSQELGVSHDEERISLDEIEEISVEDDLAPSPQSLPGERDVEMLDNAFDTLEGVDDSTTVSLDTGEAPLFESDFPARSQEDEAEALLSTLEGDEPLFEEPAPTEVRAARSSPSKPPLRTTPVPSSISKPPPSQTSRPPAGSPISKPPAAGSVDPEPRTEPEPRAAPTRDREYFQFKEKLQQREKELLQLREDLTTRERELLEQRERETKLERELSGKDEEIGKRDAQLRQIQQKVEALVAGQRRTERDLNGAREEARSATQRAQIAEREREEANKEARQRQEAFTAQQAELASAREQLAKLESEAQRERARNDELEAELAGVRAQLDDATLASDDLRAQLERQREEGDSAQEELRRRLAESEEEKEQQGDRVVKAYQRLKADDKVREKARKAMTIALQLLEDQSNDPVDDEETEREAR